MTASCKCGEKLFRCSSCNRFGCTTSWCSNCLFSGSGNCIKCGSKELVTSMQACAQNIGLGNTLALMIFAVVFFIGAIWTLVHQGIGMALFVAGLGFTLYIALFLLFFNQRRKGLGLPPVSLLSLVIALSRRLI